MKTKTHIFICFLLVLSSCTLNKSMPNAAVELSNVITVTDSALQTVEVQPDPQVVLALSSSIAEIWLLADGQLSGVTSDAIGERDLGLPNDITILGTVKDPNMESIFALKPDLVLLSQDISSHIAVADALKQAGIPHYTAKVETLDDYLKTLNDFTQITGSTDSFERNGESVKQEVLSLLSRLPAVEKEKQVTALFLRAYSTGVKVKATEHTVCTILEDIGVFNIAAKEGFPLEELSQEAILEANPDYIFVVTMGDEDAAIASLEASLLSNPAFASLSAVQNEKLIILPKDLYHFKPNNRWGGAYENLSKIVYPQVFSEN